MGAVNNVAAQDVFLNTTQPNVFVAKYNQGGVLQWATSTAPSPSLGEVAASLTTDQYGNIYVVTNTLTTSFNFYKYNYSGDLVNSNTITSTNLEITDIKADKYEALYISGGFIGSLVLGPVTLTNPGANQIGYIVKLDSQLDAVWGKSIGDGTYANKVTSISLLGEEFIYSTGTFDTLADFGNGVQLPGLGAPDAFIYKQDVANGNSIWAKSLAKDALTSFTNSTLSLDPKGHILVAGSFDGTITLEGKDLSSFPGTTDIFVIKLTPTGKLIWMKMFMLSDHSLV
jgi:hypothetical protein